MSFYTSKFSEAQWLSWLSAELVIFGPGFISRSPVVEQHGREPQDGARGDDGETAGGDGAAESTVAERVDSDEGDVLGHDHHVEDAGPHPRG